MKGYKFRVSSFQSRSLSLKSVELLAVTLLYSVILLLGTGTLIAAEEISLKGYPQSFKDMGILDDKSGDSVVINDVKFTLAPGATYNTPGNLVTSASNIEVGSRVGFVLDESGRIKSLWLMPAGVELR